MTGRDKQQPDGRLSVSNVHLVDFDLEPNIQAGDAGKGDNVKGYAGIMLRATPSPIPHWCYIYGCVVRASRRFCFLFIGQNKPLYNIDINT